MNVFKPTPYNLKYITRRAAADPERFGSNVSLGMINLATAAQGCTFSASSGVASRAFEGNRSAIYGEVTTYWEATSSAPQTITCTFPTSLPLDRVEIYIPKPTFGTWLDVKDGDIYASLGIENFSLEYFNGVSWIAWKTNISNSVKKYEKIVIGTDPTQIGIISASAVRLTINSFLGGNPVVSSFEVYGQPRTWSSIVTYSSESVVVHRVKGVDTIFKSVANNNLNYSPSSVQGSRYWQKISPVDFIKPFESVRDLVYLVDGNLDGSSIKSVFRLPILEEIDTIAIFDLFYDSYSVKISSRERIFNSSNTQTSSITTVLFNTGVVNNTSNFNSNKARNLILKPGVITPSRVVSGGTGFQRTEYTVFLEIELLPPSTKPSTCFSGNIFVGKTLPLGLTQYGASSSITDYSIKSTDEYGNITLVKRAFAKNMKVSVEVPQADIAKIQKDLQNLRATPLVWYANTDSEYEEALVMYGFYKDMSLNIAYPTYSLLELNIEALAQN